MPRCSHKTTINNTQSNMLPTETTRPTVTSHNYPVIAKIQGKDLKTNFRMIIEVFKGVNIYL